MVDQYRVQRKVAKYRDTGGYWSDIYAEIRILKNDKVILHLDEVKQTRPVKHVIHKEFKGEL